MSLKWEKTRFYSICLPSNWLRRLPRIVPSKSWTGFPTTQSNVFLQDNAKKVKTSKSVFFFLFCASQWAPQIAWGMCSEWGRPRSENQLGKTVNRPASCLSASPLSSNHLHNIVFAVWQRFPAAERRRKRGRGEVRLRFVHLGNLEFRSCAGIARWKAFFFIFFLAMRAKKNMVSDSLCAWRQYKTMSELYNVTVTHVLGPKKIQKKT